MLRHVLVCGLGSSGRRHLRHARALGAARIDAFRTGKATLVDADQPAPDHTFTSLSAALACRPQLVIVATPTAMHLPTALAAVRAGCHVLVEKPLSHTTDGLDELQAAVHQQGVVLAVGCNLRFHPLLQMLRERVQQPGALGAAVSARLHFDAYLPAWHPWEDYRVSYAARRSLGGGAALTHIHEIDYALWVFGAAMQACGMAGGAQPLGTDVDESSSILVQHANGVLSSIHLSLCAPRPSRGVEVHFEAGTWRGDLQAGTWQAVSAAGQTTQGGVDPDFSVDSTYALQLRHLAAAMAGKVPVAVGLAEGRAALQVALTVQRPLRKVA